jgi:diguanylate cyclase (GGDEF)-like protein/PAS domain S-box-containing protein
VRRLFTRAKSLRLRLGRYRSRDWLFVLAGLLVTAAVVAVAELAREDAENHLRAQSLVEQVRASGQELGAIADHAIAISALSKHLQLQQSTVIQGFAAWAELQNALQRLRGVAPPVQTTTLGRDAANLYRAGVRSLSLTKSAGLRAALIAEQSYFNPALMRMNRDAEAAAHLDLATANDASGRAQTAFIGALALGLIALLLIGWRAEASRRKVVLAAQRVEIEASGEARIRALLEHSSDVVTVVGPDLKIRWLASSVTRLLGHDPGPLIGQPLTEIVAAGDEPVVHRLLVSVLGRAGAHTETARFRQADGSMRHVEMIAENRLDDPAVDGVVISMRDVTERRAREEELRHRAFHDPLTRLANRDLFEDRLGHALAGAKRDGRSFAVLFLDLDDFKAVNDSLGHAGGDELLRDIAARISALLRPTDTAARLGGDEFAILIDVLKHEDEAHIVARRVAERLAQPFAIGEREVVVSASVGVAICSGETVLDDLLALADEAMYEAKRRGKATIWTAGAVNGEARSPAPPTMSA